MRILMLAAILCFGISCSKPTSSDLQTPPVQDTPRLQPLYSHIVVLILENKPTERIIGSADAPYINSLVSKSANFVQSYAIEHPSQPNYLDLFSGSNQGVTDNNKPAGPFKTPNLAAQLIKEGQSFATYSEDLPSVGYNGSTSGAYARKHNPVANWMGTDSNQVPATTNQPFTAFPGDFSKLPTVSFVVPSLQNDMHDGTIAEGDDWVKNNIGGYIDWASTHNSLLILTFDEDDRNYNNHIATLFVGDNVKVGSYFQKITHFTVLRTLEDIYELPAAGAAATETGITGCWEIN